MGRLSRYVHFSILCSLTSHWNMSMGASINKTLPNAQRTRGLSSSLIPTTKHTTSNLYQTLASKSWSNSALNLNKTSPSRSWPKYSFKVLTKNLLQSLNKISPSKSFKVVQLSLVAFNILTNIQVQNLYQSSASKSRPNLVNAFRRSFAWTSATLATWIELTSSKARVTSVKSTKQE